MDLWADIFNATDDKDGPIRLVSATVSRLLDGSGGLRLEAVADIRAREMLQPGQGIRVWMTIPEQDDEGNPPTLLGEGIIRRVGLAGTKLSIEANDLLEELKYDNTLINLRFDGVTVQAAISNLVANLGWTVAASGNALTQSLVKIFNGQTILKAVLSVAETTGLHIRLTQQGGRVIEVGDFGESSGLTLFDLNSSQLTPRHDDPAGVLESLSMETQIDQLANWILPVGADGLTLADSNRDGKRSIIGPDGNLNYYVQNNASITQYGIRKLYKSYPDIQALSTSAADKIAAANQLYDSAVADLENLSVVRRNYRGKILGLKTRLLPGDTVRVIYAGEILQDNGTLWPGGAVDETLYVIRSESYAGEGGLWQNVELSNVSAVRSDEATDVAVAIERSKK